MIMRGNFYLILPRVLIKQFIEIKSNKIRKNLLFVKSDDSLDVKYHANQKTF